jgi:hypothetical protein
MSLACSDAGGWRIETRRRRLSGRVGGGGVGIWN